MKQALVDALEDRGYTKLTPVQEAVTKAELDGADLLVSAQTGSGKTLGFGLAIAPTVLREDERFSRAGAPLALIIAPTRELALQVKRELDWLYAKAGATVASCVGGMDMRDERRALGRGAHVVVATPGRLRDHIMRGSIDLSEIRAVVLDEADEMLDLGFREDLEFILGEAPAERQTLMFSATVPKSIEQLAKSYQKDAVRVVTKSEKAQHADIDYRAMLVSDRDSENAVINTLRFYEAPNAIVFANTRVMVNRLTTRLSNRGFMVVALSGELSQAERSHALQAMRDGRARVCVATDVAARGIDLPNLDLVVHAELPNNHETLLHRSGRTGRAGRKGVSALVVQPKFRKKAERLLSGAKVRADWGGAPSAEEVTSRDEERMLTDPIWQVDVADSEPEIVDKLVDKFSAEQIAAAFLNLYRSQHSAPEELSSPNEKPAPRQAFGPSVWFSVSMGRNQEAEPRRLLPMLCKAGDLTKDDIGAIRIQQDESFVELRQASVANFLKALGPDMTAEAGAKLTQLDAPPVLTPFARQPSGPRKDGPKPGGARHGGPKPRQDRSEHQERAAPAEKAPAKKWDKPRAETGGKPASTPPVDWNDAPTPRVKKPKAADGPAPKKPRHKSGATAAMADGSVTAVPRRSADPSVSLRGDKPRGKHKGAPSAGGKPGGKNAKAKPYSAGKPGGKPGGKFGGKPSRGGNAPPTRRKP